MTIKRCTMTAAALLFAVAANGTASAAELVYGSWTPAREYQNRVVMPDLFKNIEKETNGRDQVEAVRRRTARRRQDHLHRRQGRPDAGRARHRDLCAEHGAVAVYAIYSTVILGHNDVVAATGAALETMYLNCPSCLEEMKKLNAVVARRLDQLGLSARLPRAGEIARRPERQAHPRHRRQRRNVQAGRRGAGRRDAGRGGGLLQRGGLDCQHGIADWLRTFGYADFAKHVIDMPLGLTGPAIGFFMNRDTWNKLHARAEEAPSRRGGLAERQDGDRQLHRSPTRKASSGHQGQGRPDGQGRQRFRERRRPNTRRSQRDTNIETAQEFGVKDPGADHRRLREEGREVAPAIEGDRPRRRQVRRGAEAGNLLQDRLRQAVSRTAGRAVAGERGLLLRNDGSTA